MEKAGTGIKRVTDACNANGNKCTFNFSDAFWVTIKSNVTNKVGEKVGEKVGKKVGEKLTGNQLTIVNQMQKEPYISAKVLADIVGISVRKIETNIKKLKDLGIIERIGPPKGGHWKIIEHN
jgi:ATP-dependent DNA helicase RecG